MPARRPGMRAGLGAVRRRGARRGTTRPAMSGALGPGAWALRPGGVGPMRGLDVGGTRHAAAAGGDLDVLRQAVSGCWGARRSREAHLSVWRPPCARGESSSGDGQPGAASSSGSDEDGGPPCLAASSDEEARRMPGRASSGLGARCTQSEGRPLAAVEALRGMYDVAAPPAVRNWFGQRRPRYIRNHIGAALPARRVCEARAGAAHGGGRPEAQPRRRERGPGRCHR